jgi:hypothetical protein
MAKGKRVFDKLYIKMFSCPYIKVPFNFTVCAVGNKFMKTDDIVKVFVKKTVKKDRVYFKKI